MVVSPEVTQPLGPWVLAPEAQMQLAVGFRKAVLLLCLHESLAVHVHCCVPEEGTIGPVLVECILCLLFTRIERSLEEFRLGET